MPSQSTTRSIASAFEAAEGVLRLAPTWVPRSFCVPGQRIKLHPRDLYAFGANRGGIDERWLSSTTKADNGPLTTADEGLSYVVGDSATGGDDKLLFSDVVDELGATLLGDALWSEYGRWPMYSKFFDNQGPLPHHMHQMEQHAAEVGLLPKPEAYYFPPQLNNHGGDFPHTFFGLEPGTTEDQVRHCLEVWNEGDNMITALSKAYRLELGTGWFVPAGLLHAPGSLCTYEPQWASDIFAMFESLVNDAPIAWELLVKHVPEGKQHDLDYILSMLDWEANLEPNVKATYFRPPLPAGDEAEMADAGYSESWIVYGNEYVAAKELTVLPGRTATVADDGPYGLIAVQGHGTINGKALESPALIRFGQLTHDEYFVAASAAEAGVTIANSSATDPLVILKHFVANDATPSA